MDFKSEVKYIRISPRKLRRVADAVKHLPLPRMLAALRLLNKKGAAVLLKAVKTAVSNVENSRSLSMRSLKLKSLEVNEGVSFKRWHPVSRGSAHPYKKRTSHIRIVITDKK